MEVTYYDYREKVGRTVRSKREERGISRETLALRIEGICAQTIRRLENNCYSKDITLFTIQSVCKELDISVKMTLGGS
jgi:ribosome-binding protein aMBF1 (putative translation factor)